MLPCLNHLGGLTMRQILVVACLATILVAGQTSGADRVNKKETAESKAEVLEQNAAAEGSKVLPSPSEIITKSGAQAVDPVGEEPLDDAITCLSRTIYWEARGIIPSGELYELIFL